MATEAQVNEVRENIGETIPANGVDSDTMFTDEQIIAWIDGTTNLDAASLRGWKVKLAHFANLVNVTDGAASREMSDLFEHAKEMVKTYTKLAQGPAAGRTRVGRIVRE